MKTITIFLFFTALWFTTEAQSGYPVEIKQGETKTFTADLQSLWVITSSQMDSVIITGEHLKLCNEQNRQYINKISKLESIQAEQVAIIDTLQNGYEHYSALWQTCDNDLEKAEKNIVKHKKLHKWFAAGGVALGIGLTLLITNL